MTIKKTANIIVIVTLFAAFCLLAAGPADAMSKMKKKKEATETTQTQETAPEATETVVEEVVTEETAEGEAEAVETDEAPVEVATPVKTLDETALQNALAQRTQGNPDAPVVIQEFASLSCPHCADFHKMNYKRLKSDYIDTGKVYFIYNDYPLNAPALSGTVVARCLPEERYFSFLSFLFENQQKWVFADNVDHALKQNAKLVGADEETLNACLNSEALKKGIVDNMEALGKEFDIKSTPTFYINGKMLSGALPYETFQKEIESALAEANGAAEEQSAPAVEDAIPAVVEDMVEDAVETMEDAVEETQPEEEAAPPAENTETQTEGGEAE